MKEQKRYDAYFPTVWIDSDNQDTVFQQGRILSVRKEKGKQMPLKSESVFQMIEEDGQYRYLYEYGYLDPNSNFDNKEKYIKSRIQSIDNPQLEVEQFIYRPSNKKHDLFSMNLALINNKSRRLFLSCQYGENKYVGGTIFLYPCSIKNKDNNVIVATEHQIEAYHQYEKISSAMKEGEEGLQFVHYNNLGTYSVHIPLVLDERVLPYLYDYFDASSLPSIEDIIIKPESLDFYVDLTSR